MAIVPLVKVTLYGPAAEKDAVLSAGHLHISEIFILFEEAVKRGVKRRLVQHPTYTIDATLEDIMCCLYRQTFK